MDELQIKIDDNINNNSSEVKISIDNKPEETLLYKFMLGNKGTWEVLKNFSEDDNTVCNINEEGQYIIMVQAKRKDSTRPFDYVSKIEYTKGKDINLEILDTEISKDKLSVGEKIKIAVNASKPLIMYRYFLKENFNWELIKDYSTDNTLVFLGKEAGLKTIVIQCKEIDSDKDYDCSEEVKIEVIPYRKAEIVDFKCFSEELLQENELLFQIETKNDEDRTILYKFIRMDSKGNTECIQNYSTKRIVSFIEKVSGEYKLLCLVKDMYSQREFDDRAIINYTVKPYKDIVILNFTSDLSSPQAVDTPIEFKASVKGGRTVVYKYIFEGNEVEDSGYMKSDSFTWVPKHAGQYKISLLVKDSSFEGEYECLTCLDYIIDEKNDDPVIINSVAMDKNKTVVHEKIHIYVAASGGSDLRYCFIVKKDGEETERIDYGTCNWVNFTPEEIGNYEIEVRVKDKYSQREYDWHEMRYVEVFEYMPANIEHVLMPIKEYYVCGETAAFQVIVQNTKDILIKYELRINGHKFGETEFSNNDKYLVTPHHRGEYSIVIYAKNINSDKVFDCKRVIKFKVYDAPQIRNTRIIYDKPKFTVNEATTFTAKCEGGKDIVYQFFIMEDGDWSLVQDYSKKNYYSFIPFVEGIYKILVLCKSTTRQCAYEDYDILEFLVQ